MDIERYLEDIEARLVPETEDEVEAAWLKWARHENTEHFEGCPRPARASKLDWPSICVNDAFADHELMLLSQFANVNMALEQGSGRPLYVRANYGVGNVATTFGAPLFMMEREMNTLPNVRMIGPEKAVEFARGEAEPDIEKGNFADIWYIAERFAEIRDRYPNIGRYVRFEQPDLQGPMDNCELLWGSEIFYELYDDPDTIHMLLGRVTDLLDHLIARWNGMFPRGDRTCSYFSHIESGGIAIRDDSAMNLSPAFFDEFIAPYDGRLLKKYGGVVHFCGRGDHYIDSLTRLEGLHGINMSQPHLNDMERILSATADRGINISISAPHIDLTGHDAARVIYL